MPLLNEPIISHVIGQKTVFAIFLFFLFFSPSFAGATTVSDAQANLDVAAKAAYGGEAYSKDITVTIGIIVGTALSFVGVLFFLLIVYAGIIWMTARGNDQDVTKAKDLMQSAIIGLIIVLSAYAITTFITSNLLGK
jgi:hypothetical protein